MRPRRLWPYYALLLARPSGQQRHSDGRLPGAAGLSKVIVSCAVVFMPVFFAGVIFATAFRSSTQPDVDFGSNIAGIILGGLSEYFSLVLGFNHLLWVAIGYYLLSALLHPARFARREVNAATAEQLRSCRHREISPADYNADSLTNM